MQALQHFRSGCTVHSEILATDLAWLGSTACTSASLMALPTASTVHTTESAHVTAQSAAQDYTYYF